VAVDVVASLVFDMGGPNHKVDGCFAFDEEAD
jgi:hypothetical protein